jgi:hypothetical protein
VLLQTGRVHLPGTAEARALARELEAYEIRVTENANDTYGAFKVGTHDDLVTALGLAVQGREGRVASPPARGVAFNPLEFVRGWKRRGGTGGTPVRDRPSPGDESPLGPDERVRARKRERTPYFFVIPLPSRMTGGCSRR